MVVTGSMEPTIVPKEMIIIQEKDEYNEGDIITYKDNFSNLITHRIVAIDGEKYITKGDGNEEADDIIKKEDIKGKVIKHSYTLGWIYLYALKPLLVIIIVMLVLLK